MSALADEYGDVLVYVGRSYRVYYNVNDTTFAIYKHEHYNKALVTTRSEDVLIKKLNKLEGSNLKVSEVDKWMKWQTKYEKVVANRKAKKPMAAKVKNERYGKVLARFTSSKDPSKKYDIRGTTNNPTCNCQGFIYRRYCTHEIKFKLRRNIPLTNTEKLFAESKGLV